MPQLVSPGSHVPATAARQKRALFTSGTWLCRKASLVSKADRVMVLRWASGVKKAQAALGLFAESTQSRRVVSKSSSGVSKRAKRLSGLSASHQLKRAE